MYVFIFNYENFVFSHRGVNGLCLFPVHLRQTCSSIHVQRAIADVLMKLVLKVVRVYTHTHTMILICSAAVTEKVKYLECFVTCHDIESQLCLHQ